MDPKYALKALIKAGMSEERAARFAKSYIDDKSSIAAQIRELKDDFPDLFAPVASDDTPDENEPKPGLATKVIRAQRAAVASVKDGSKTSSAATAQALGRRRERPQPQNVSRATQAAVDELQRGTSKNAVPVQTNKIRPLNPERPKAKASQVSEAQAAKLKGA
ncbi:hypothetical protein ABTX80_13770 [Streptomyces erythrochromogenes]|uniref:hypothetical protein n=1 Tax=Streptomyces erythrochromogenes TaxID=285574 RepID=UPI00332D6DBB